MPILNRELIQRGEAIFNNTGSYQFEGGFANRDVSTEFLVQNLSSSHSNRPTILVSDLLGAGKTVLVNNVRNQFSNDPGTAPLPITRASFLDELRQYNQGKPPFLVIDEVDNKSEVSVLHRKLSAVAELPELGGVPVVILGDYTLKSGRLSDVLGIGNGLFVPMEPLDRGFFKLAIAQRIGSVLKANAPDEEFEQLFQDKFLNLLVPSLGGPCATFRQTLQTLNEMLAFVPSDNEAANISVELFDKYWTKKGPAATGFLGRHGESYAKLKAFVRERLNSNGTSDIQPLTEDQMRQLFDAEDEGEEDFFEDFIEPFVGRGLLRYLGNPFENGDDDRFQLPGPFLPMPAMLLDAAVGK